MHHLLYKGLKSSFSMWSEWMTVTTDKTFIYHSFGLNIASEIPLPELEFLSELYTNIDVVIKKSNLNEKWNLIDASHKNGFCVIENTVMFEVPDLAIFSIEEGQNIYFHQLYILMKIKFAFIYLVVVWAYYLCKDEYCRYMVVQ